MSDESDRELCIKINSIMAEFEKKIEKETGCTVEGTAIAFTTKDNEYTIALQTGPYENVDIMEGEVNYLDVNYPEIE